MKRREKSSRAKHAQKPPAGSSSVVTGLLRLTSPDGAKLAEKVGASPTDSARDFTRRAQQYVTGSAGITSTLLACRLMTQLANLQPWNYSDRTIEGTAHLAADLFEEFKPASLVEAWLVVQLFSVHETATSFLYRATLPNQPAEFVDRNVNRATRLMRLFGEQLDAWAKLKGKAGQQRMTVEHVHIYPGGKAIVGPIAAPLTGGPNGGLV